MPRKFLHKFNVCKSFEMSIMNAAKTQHVVKIMVEVVAPDRQTEKVAMNWERNAIK